jgi:integrase
MSIQARSTKRRGTVYDVRLRDPIGKVYTRTFNTKREAIAFEAGEQTDRRRGLWVDPRKAETTFGEWAELWSKADPTKKPKTLATDESMLKVHLLPAFGPKPLGVINPLDVQRFVAGLSGKYAPSTTRRIYAVLRAILNAAVDADLIGRSPCRGVKLPTVEQRTRPVITAAELRSLADEIAAEHRVIPYLGALLGLRWGEIAALRVGRLDLLRGTLTVAEGVIEVRGVQHFGPPKSAMGRRTIALPHALSEMLSAHLSARGLTAATPDAFVFADGKGGALRYSNWRRRVWLPTTQAAGLAGLEFHDLRRANATEMLRSGVDLRTAQTRLGHSDPRLTIGTYAQSTTEGDRDAANRLADRLLAPEGDERAIDAR